MIVQKYKFFVNSKVVILCDNPGRLDEILDSTVEFIIKKYESKQQLKEIIDILLDHKSIGGFIIYASDVEKLKDEFLNHFECIDAAGGLVRNAEGKVLLMYRRGSWDLPKGKVDEGETLIEAAIREVQEETGLMELELGDPILFNGYKNEATFHSYPYKKHQAMKISFWYEMNYVGNGTPVPQAEEDIEKIKWVNPDDLPNYFGNMYPSIIDVIESVFGK